MDIFYIYNQVASHLMEQKASIKVNVTPRILCSLIMTLLLTQFKVAQKQRYDLLYYEYDFYLLDIIPILENYVIGRQQPIVRSFYDVKEIPTSEVEQKFRNVLYAGNYEFVLPRTPPPRENIKPYIGDAARVNIFQRYSYEHRSHFLNTINQYQGIQKTNIDDDFLEKIRDELRKYKLITDRDYSRVEKKHIKFILRGFNAAKKYNDQINLIWSHITGKKLDDISYLTDKLLLDFEMFCQEFYRRYQNQGNFNYKNLLYQLLLRHGHPCNKNDFNFLKTTARRIYQDKICREIFAQLSWTYYPMF